MIKNLQQVLFRYLLEPTGIKYKKGLLICSGTPKSNHNLEFVLK